jgi:hypothetical protein
MKYYATTVSTGVTEQNMRYWHTMSYEQKMYTQVAYIQENI